MQYNLKEIIKTKIKQKLKYNCYVQDAKRGNFDLSIPLFSLAKETGKDLLDIYKEIEKLLKKEDFINDINFLNGFLNIKLNRVLFSKNILNTIIKQKDKYETLPNNKKVVVIDYSSPNIAKNFSIGHLRSTVIGNSLKLIYRKLGYKVIGINYLGDWGNNFGQLLVGYKKWVNKEAYKKDPIKELQRVYVKFHTLSKDNEELNNEARKEFRQLEKGNKTNIKLWIEFSKKSVLEFKKVYNLLGVSFELYQGESFFNDKMTPVIKELEDKNLLKLDDGATIVDLGDNYPPALIKRSDGGALYLTRDLTALLYRYKNYNFDKILYVVGNEQKLHFKQLKEVSKKMGYNLDISHINFGLILIDGKKMATRSGKTADLYETLKLAINEAKKNIISKNSNLKNMDEVSKKIGVGAIIFNDLKNDRKLDANFNLEEMLRYEGQTGPYIQYSSVRINSILKDSKFNIKKVTYNIFNDDQYFNIVQQLSRFGEVLIKSKEDNNPSELAKYLLNLSQEFNRFYAKNRILVNEEAKKQTNLLLIKAIRIVLNEGLRLLGIDYLNEM